MVDELSRVPCFGEGVLPSTNPSWVQLRRYAIHGSTCHTHPEALVDHLYRPHCSSISHLKAICFNQPTIPLGYFTSLLLMNYRACRASGWVFFRRRTYPGFNSGATPSLAPLTTPTPKHSLIIYIALTAVASIIESNLLQPIHTSCQPHH